MLEALLTRSGYLTELEESVDPQDAGRVDNLQELVSVARGVHRADRGAGAPTTKRATLAGSWSRWRWSPTPTRSLPTTPTTRAWSP
ncbi:hypothetical protein TPA0907_02720 [Micromonospora humidisoli]|nr:hypothetical protein TPA0907_02720 [Micromonospora sp. AKA109]